MTRGSSPQGTSPNAKYVAFMGYFLVYSHLLSLYTLPFPFLSSLFLYPSLSYNRALPFPKEVNKKLSYRTQNLLGIIKHT